MAADMVSSMGPFRQIMRSYVMLDAVWMTEGGRVGGAGSVLVGVWRRCRLWSWSLVSASVALRLK
jgi:hypothetical protein